MVSSSSSVNLNHPRYPVWDIGVRLFHWLLLLLLIGAWITVERGNMLWHSYCGYALLTLLLFRLFWGLWGSHYARFSQFIRSPKAVIDYFKGRSPHAPGHNPAGGWSVAAMLLLLLLQAISGLFAYDDILFEGPWYGAVSAEIAERLTQLHHLNFNLIMALVGLHIGAIILYRLRGEALIIAMVKGKGEGRYSYSTYPPAPLWRMVLTLLLAVAIVVLLLWLAPEPEVSAFY
ncbi:hypothetical protein D5085_14260 [Ectothiorhodospiraceae bacterium BW-2]|nr:hypothetical protein D5085_14260 [Ectothiorhodospiraceae bacterium BW-2]